MRGDSSLSFTHIGTEIIEGKIQETLLSLESCHLFLYKLIKLKIRYFVRMQLLAKNITITVFFYVKCKFLWGLMTTS